LFVYAAKELIEALLKTDPDKRLTIHQVMKHKWIAVRTVCLQIPHDTSECWCCKANTLRNPLLTLSVAIWWSQLKSPSIGFNPEISQWSG